MKYQVVVSENEDGFTAFIPALRGCWSQGDTLEEAVENIKSAATEYLKAARAMGSVEIIHEKKDGPARPPRLPYRRLLTVLQSFGFRVLREGRYVIMAKGTVFVAFPRYDPINRSTLIGVLKDAGIDLDEFLKEL